MNTLDKLRRIRTAQDTMRQSNRSGGHHECFRASPGGETEEHIRTKFEIWLALRKRGVACMTEAVFKNGKRADCIDMINHVIYEVLHNETDDEFLEKIKDYPSLFEIRRVRTGEPFNEQMID